MPREIIVVIFVASFLVVLLSLSAKALVDDFNKFHEKRAVAMEARKALENEVKETCNIIHKDLGDISAVVTYECPDGIQYTFTEWF